MIGNEMVQDDTQVTGAPGQRQWEGVLATMIADNTARRREGNMRD